MRKFGAISDFRAKLSSINPSNGTDFPLAGMGVMLSDGMTTDALAGSLDWLWFDMEHNALSPEILRNHIFIAHGRNVPCFVRIPGPNHFHTNSTNSTSDVSARIWSMNIKQVLDMGCDGIVVPEVRTRSDVINIINDCKYPLHSDHNSSHSGSHISSVSGQNGFLTTFDHHRGFSKIIGSDYGRIKIDSDYVNRANNSVFVCVMIETYEAFENIEDIVSVDGLDAIMIGMGDLKASLKMKYDAKVLGNDRLMTVMDKIYSAANKYGKNIIFSGLKFELASQMVKKYDIRIVKLGDDVTNLVKYANVLKKQLKAKL